MSDQQTGDGEQEETRQERARRKWEAHRKRRTIRPDLPWLGGTQ